MRCLERGWYTMSGNPSQWLDLELSGGRYRITARLGEGGMGFVYKAQDANLNTPVVIKVPRRAMLDDPQFVERFQREIRSLVALSHRQIVKITDVGQYEGIPFAVMQFLAGGDLEGRRPQDGAGRPRAVSPSALSGWLPEVAGALDFIHRQGYVHRDVKPGNVLFDTEDHAYLSDFGVAKVVRDAESGGDAASMTGTGMIVGTPEYMARELVMGQEITGRVDQYALAVTVYELLAGHPPFVGQSSSAILVEQATKQVPALDTVQPKIPAALSSAVSRALSKDPADRYTTCGEFAEAVLSTSTAVVERSPTRVERPVEPARPHTMVESPAPSVPPPIPGPPVRNPTVQQPAPAAGTDRMRLSCPSCDKKLRVTAQLAGKVVGCPNCKTKLQIATDLSRLTAVQERSPTNVEQPVVRAGPATMVEAPSVAPATPPRLPAIEQPSLVGTDASQAKIDTAAKNQSSSSTGVARTDVTNSIGMRLQLIAAGTFMMGSPPSEPDRYADETQHRVRIGKPFYLGVYEVTQGQYEKLMGANPSRFKGDNNPVEQVSWEDAALFCRELSARPEEQAAGRVYRLPTEAEWEYACRAGTTTAYSFGSEVTQLAGYAWFGDNSGKMRINSQEIWRTDQDNYGKRLLDNGCQHHVVGSKRANAWGLYDMHGNVWEWCQDWYGDYPSGSTTDPTGAASGSPRVFRGGSWRSGAEVCRSAYRHGDSPSRRSSGRGFRVALSPSGQ